MSLVEHHAASAPMRHGNLRDRVAGQSLFTELARLQSKGEFNVDSIRGRVHVGTEARSWYTGLLGERRVAAILSQLGPDVTVLHSVPVGTKSSDIDHIVISQAGVFTINTKNHPGHTAWVAGYGMMIGSAKVSHVRNAVHEAKRASRLLSARSGLTVPVAAIVALVGVTKLTTKAPPIGDGAPVSVVRDFDLLRSLSGAPVFSLEQVQRIVAIAVRPETWAVPADADPCATALLEAFIDQESGVRSQLPNMPVHRSSVTRLGWIILGTVAGLFGLLGSVIIAALASARLAGL
jgi:hypothetical protein